VLTIRSALISLQSLLSSPEPNDPQVLPPTAEKLTQDAEVAKHYLSDRASFDATARYWAETFAGAPSKKPSAQTTTTTTPKIGIRWAVVDVDVVQMHGLSFETVDRYVAMGFDREVVVENMRKLNIRSLTSSEIEGERGGKLLEELLSTTM
jgi:ubiquitin-conjugating enzyme (huntingtin interacting protein 2)